MYLLALPLIRHHSRSQAGVACQALLCVRKRPKNIDVQGYVTGIRSAGFHPNLARYGGTVTTAMGPVHALVYLFFMTYQ